MTDVVLATRSAGKLRELLPLLAEAGCVGRTLEDLGLPESDAEEALEVHDTFEANALAKARYFAALTGLVVLADDSGLAVDALDGRPGVRSKRWSGRADLHGTALDAENNRFLQVALSEAARFGREERTARYVCAAAGVGPGGSLVVRGETCGVLLTAPRGAGGFGYDPYFLSDDLGQTFAEVERDAKAAVSHRGRAFRGLLARVHEFASPR
ncbi:MAG: non-canonical purine NTP pyrophosphatase [Gemmatimonadaceae bacterium]|nr:non-canonical purine NTP pyrophosphatase [Gemmatimonadaceae bacterium]